jgi:hypothetical protein
MPAASLFFDELQALFEKKIHLHRLLADLALQFGDFAF